MCAHACTYNNTSATGGLVDNNLTNMELHPRVNFNTTVHHPSLKILRKNLSESIQYTEGFESHLYQIYCMLTRSYYLASLRFPEAEGDGAMNAFFVANFVNSWR